ncbi:unnamed protein product [Euphydryas editha]|uniref:UBA domain-containing protein n=1 Tax=Euphydryas editha TaxID=104508 RepID=A0AAU9TNW1_EUPED|nr:unnamed protein product [Euphydryas editha]
MGYPADQARAALRLAGNEVNKAVDLLVAGCSSLLLKKSRLSLTLENSCLKALTSFSKGVIMDLTSDFKMAISDDITDLMTSINDEELILMSVKLLSGDANPSTSAGSPWKKLKKEAKEKRRAARERALRRLRGALRADEDDHLGGSLAEEEQFLLQYKGLL